MRTYEYVSITPAGGGFSRGWPAPSARVRAGRPRSGPVAAGVHPAADGQEVLGIGNHGIGADGGDEIVVGAQGAPSLGDEEAGEVGLGTAAVRGGEKGGPPGVQERGGLDALFAGSAAG